MPQDRIEIPIGDEIIDVSGLTVLPCFVTAHVHDALSSRNSQAWAQSGVTTVRDLGSRSLNFSASRR